MSKKKKKRLIICIAILLALIAVSIIIAALPLKSDVEEIIEHNATISEVSAKNESYELSVSEYSCLLIISKDEVIDEKNLFDLSFGDSITFCVPNYYDELLNDSSIKAIPIVSLKVRDTDIVTLESHNQAEGKSYMKVRITAAVFSGIFLCGTIICLMFLLKSKKSNANEESEQPELL